MRYKINHRNFNNGKGETLTFAALEQVIMRAKECVAEYYGCGKQEDRKWLEASPPDSYTNADYHCTVLVWEGSPPKGYVLILGTYVVATGCSGGFIHRWQVSA